MVKSVQRFVLPIVSILAVQPAFAQETAPDDFRRATQIAVGSSFAEEVRNRGIDGLIGTLAAKNRT